MRLTNNKKKRMTVKLKTVRRGNKNPKMRARRITRMPKTK